MAEFRVPALAEHITEATITQWLRADGELIAAGDELVEVETDKATSVLEADSDGVLAILAREGETVPVGVPIAIIGAAAPPPATNDATAIAAVVDVDSRNGSRIVASPVARRMAQRGQVDLRQIAGTGPAGRILKRDVVTALQTPAPAPAPLTAVPDPPPGPAGTPPRRTVSPMTRLQRLVAGRMSESNATVPDFVVEADVDMSGCRTLRRSWADLGADPVPSYNDLVIKAAALALTAFPKANNALFAEGEITYNDAVNVGFAVAAGDNLVVPTVFGAADRSVGAIARDTRALIAKVKDGRIEPRELAGGTFTVSNLGMFGVPRFTAVVSPPQAAILAVGAIQDRPVVRDGELAVGFVMTITLTSDHRLLYGADAAQFVDRVRHLLERPMLLVM